MQIKKSLIHCALTFAALGLSANTLAQVMAEGVVRRIDLENNKITIRHGEIKALDMPPMTMVFQVKDASVLETLKAGDKVRFVVQKSDTGFVVTDIQAAK